MIIRSLVAFTGLPEKTVWEKIVGGQAIAREAWLKFAAGRKPEEIPGADLRRWYAETDCYLWDLAQWHMGEKRPHDEDCARVWSEHGIRTVLDFGAGIGSNAVAFARRGMDVTAVEVRGVTGKFLEQRVNDLRLGHRIEVVLLDDPLKWLSKQKGKRKPWDAVYCSDVLEHLPSHQEALDAAKLLRKWAAKTAYLNVTFGTMNGSHPMHLPENPEVAKAIAEVAGR